MTPHTVFLPPREAPYSMDEINAAMSGVQAPLIAELRLGANLVTNDCWSFSYIDSTHELLTRAADALEAVDATGPPLTPFFERKAWQALVTEAVAAKERAELALRNLLGSASRPVGASDDCGTIAIDTPSAKAVAEAQAVLTKPWKYTPDMQIFFDEDGRQAEIDGLKATLAEARATQAEAERQRDLADKALDEVEQDAARWVKQLNEALAALAHVRDVAESNPYIPDQVRKELVATLGFEPIEVEGENDGRNQ